MPYICTPCSRVDIVDFIEAHHYSHNLNGVMVRYSFKLIDEENNLVGAMVSGGLGMANAWKKYAKRPEEVIELRRLVLIDDTKRNAESYFIGASLRWLKKNTDISTVISYADPNNGHVGIVYKASNFERLGETAKGKVIKYNGRTFHDKAIRSKYNGELKPFAVRLKAALETGDAVYENTVPKIIYKYDLT